MSAPVVSLARPANDTSRATAWREDSWRDRPAQQMPEYEDAEALAAVEAALQTYPPLVLAAETRQLRAQIADAAAGRAFILQGGDCAESFDAFQPEHIRASFDLVLDMAAVLETASGLPVATVGRMAGQFAKPRSDAFETHGDVVLPSYRGDMINGAAFTAEARRAAPERIMTAYHQSAATLNLLRGEAQARQRAFYTAHESLLLPYEQALTRREEDGPYDLSAHFLWIGDRTRQPDGAHIEFLRGIENPIGLKCGPSLTVDDLAAIVTRLNPANTPGRLTLISRMGADGIADRLPALLRAARAEGWNVLWCCDPMHGNTYRSKSGFKTRAVNDIAGEIRQFFALHRAEGTIAGGVQLELTGRDVTECVGGAAAVTDAGLGARYHSPCDPRLNPEQSMEIAAVIAEELATNKRI